VLAHLVERYGGEARAVAVMVAADPSLGEPLVPTLPYLRAEAVYAVRYEMARSLDDVLARRTRARLLARDATADAADEVARLLAPELGWSPADATREAAAYRAVLEAERQAAGLPRSGVTAGAGR
jgi:glycerol-3-phosphate dehydrogenase